MLDSHEVDVDNEADVDNNDDDDDVEKLFCDEPWFCTGEIFPHFADFQLEFGVEKNEGTMVE